MATTIRLTRMGKKKRPFYRLVVLDSRKRRDGAYLANLGYYNPFVEPYEVRLHADEIVAWLGKGATVSNTARSLLKREGVLYRFSLIRQGLTEDEIASRMEEWRDGAGKRIARQEEDRLRHLRHIEDAEQKRRDDADSAKQAAADGEPAIAADGEPATATDAEPATAADAEPAIAADAEPANAADAEPATAADAESDKRDEPSAESGEEPRGEAAVDAAVDEGGAS